MSNETKWTPGTWQAFIPIDGDRWTIASHRGPLVADCGIGENKYSGANAHLIAAAPDMYEALDEAVLWLRAAFECKTWNWDQDQREAAEFFLKEGASALAKARGEQS